MNTIKLSPEKIEQIKQEIIRQTGEIAEEPWDEETLNDELENIRKDMERILGCKVDDTLVLRRFNSLYDEIIIEELEIKDKLGERIPYSDIDLENFPDKEHGGKPFENVLRGKCIAGCIVSMFRGTYKPSDMDEKAPMINVTIADETDEFFVSVFGKNESVIKQWENIQIGDYVEITNVSVSERREKNEDYDEEMEEDPEDNPKYVGTGEPKFNFWFASENIESIVQKIDENKYPELPNHDKLFGCKTMRIFTSEDGGRYAVEGTLISIDKYTSGEKGRVIRGSFIVQIGKERKEVIANFSRSATRSMPLSKDEIQMRRMKVLGWYNPETNIFKIDRVYHFIKNLNGMLKKRKLIKKKKTKKAKKSNMKEELDDFIIKIMENEDDVNRELSIMELKEEGLMKGWSDSEIMEGIEKHPELEVVEMILGTFKIKEDENSADEDSYEEPEIDETEEEDTTEKTSEINTDRIKDAIINGIKTNINDPRALIQFTNMTQQIGNIKLVKEAYDELLDDGIIEETGENEKKVYISENKTNDQKKEPNINPDTKIVINYFTDNPSPRGYTLNQLKRVFKDVDIKTIMEKYFTEPVKAGDHEIRNIAPNRWRMIKLK
nr:MAG: hypothetical protein [Lokiarchaeota virus Ratatoskr Meg22_1012]